MSALSSDLIALLACPACECRAPLRSAHDRLECTRCGLRYRVESGWAVLIPEEAEAPAGGADHADAAGASR